MKPTAHNTYLKAALAPFGLALTFALLAGANGDNGCASDDEPVPGSACTAATECKGDPGVDCLGAWNCIEGACAFECTPEPPAPTGCYSDRDCTDGKVCNAAEACMAPPCRPNEPCPDVCYGACVEPPAEIQCTSSEQCGIGEHCSTEDGVCDSACPPGAETCAAVCAGTCVPNAGCVTDRDCGVGFMCEAGLCRERSETCSSNDECPTGWTCAPECAASPDSSGAERPAMCPNVCQPPAGICENGEVCGEGERCGSVCEVVCPECQCAPGESCACPCYEDCKVGCFAGCASDVECGPGEICHIDACGPEGCSGICAPGEKPYDCKTDSDCIDSAGQVGVCQLDHCESAAPPCDPSQESCDALPPACYGFCEFAGPITCDPNGSTCPAGTRCEAVSSCGGPGFGIPCMLEYQCVPDAPKSCTSDCDCDPALACSDGQCVPMGRLNECEVRACETDSDCADGEYCGCGSDPSCPMCDVCLFQCMPKPVDQGCYQDSDCKPGYQCEMTTCDPSRPCPAAGQCVPVDDGACIRTGCSGQVCASEMVASTCEYAEWYECYDLARCGLNAAGLCGWEPNEDFLACMRARGGPVP